MRKTTSPVVSLLSLMLFAQVFAQSFALSLISLPAMAAAEPTESTANSSDTANIPAGAKQSELLQNQPPLLVWSPDTTQTQAKGVVLCLHELGMHSGVFADLGKRLADKGYIVYSMDERGFGGWEKMKGNDAKMSITRILADIKEAAQALKKKHDLPVFLLGEAMGGTLVLKAAADNPGLIQGTISSTPGGEHFRSGHNYMTVCKHLIQGPSKRFPMGKELIAAATPQSEKQDYLQNEAKVRVNLTPKELMACQFFMYKAKSFAHQIKTTPVLIVQGNLDGETKPISAKHVYDSLSTEDKKLVMVEDGDHYVYEGKHVNDNAMKDTIAWLDNHLPAK